MAITLDDITATLKESLEALPTNGRTKAGRAVASGLHSNIPPKLPPKLSPELPPKIPDYITKARAAVDKVITPASKRVAPLADDIVRSAKTAGKASKAGVFSKIPKIGKLAGLGVLGLTGAKIVSDMLKGDPEDDKQLVKEVIATKPEMSPMDRMIMDYLKPVQPPRSALPTAGQSATPVGQVTKPKNSELDRMVGLMAQDARTRMLEAEAERNRVDASARAIDKILSR